MNTASIPNQTIKPTSRDFLKDGERIVTNIVLISEEMRHLSKAFATVGNEKVSDQLYNVHIECDAYAKDLRELISAQHTKNLLNAQEFSASILTAVLGGVELSKKI